MLSFLQYREANLLLAEAEANTHSTHIEDLCIIDRKRGIAKALGGILHIKKQFGVSSSKQTIEPFKSSIKIFPANSSRSTNNIFPT